MIKIIARRPVAAGAGCTAYFDCMNVELDFGAASVTRY